MLAVPEGSGGKHARCPSCGETTLIPPATASDPIESANEERWAFLNRSASSNGPSAQVGSDFNDVPAAKVNPFSDAASGDVRGSGGFTSHQSPPTGELNPYAPPAPVDYSVQELKPSDSQRPGLPWEIEPSVGAWWDTIKLVCSETNTAFRRMRTEGGYSNPTTFGMASVGATLAINAVLQTAFQAARAGPGAGEVVFGNVCGVVAGALLVPTIGWHISSALVHLFLSLAGGCNRGYETTFRAMAFSTGGSILIQAIPCAGGLIYLIFGLYVNMIAIKCAHETTGGKAAFAVLAPFFLFLAVGIGLAVWIVSMVNRRF